MGREFRILAALAPTWPKAPRPLAHCDDASVIGTPFYVMERVQGVILRAKTPEGLVLDPPAMKRASEATCDTLAEIHNLDWRAVGLGDLGKPDGYVERQVRGWTERYAKAKTDDVPQIVRLGAWLEEHRPTESGATLVHNDFKYDNVVLSPDLGRVLAVLDWEMATIGDPLMDLGTALGYWIEPDDPPVFQVTVFGPTNRPGNLTRVQFAERWSRATGRDASNVLFYYAFALFKLAVVAQQLYKRWVDGHTKEERYAMMIEGVRAVATSALVAIDKGRIDRLGE
jgi:aminoglycoside phosphotransferase (APT) family kinase protein